MRRAVPKLFLSLTPVVALVFAAPDTSFRFVLLGDRTGEAQPEIYERVLKQAAAEQPAFVVSVGDTIEGLNDATAAAEWREALALRRAYQKNPFYLTPGNHDVWSPLSEKLYRQSSGHPLHYSFDYAQAHFTILDNSRSDDLSTEELSFLENDLQAHASQPVKFILSHRPSWLLHVALRNPDFALHRLAKKYGARYVVAGHIHQMLHVDMDAISYISLPSAGGHLRLSGKYEDGWFFGYTLVEVSGARVQMHIKEIGGRTTGLDDWGILGLVKRASHVAQ